MTNQNNEVAVLKNVFKGNRGEENCLVLINANQETNISKLLKMTIIQKVFKDKELLKRNPPNSVFDIVYCTSEEAYPIAEELSTLIKGKDLEEGYLLHSFLCILNINNNSPEEIHQRLQEHFNRKDNLQAKTQLIIFDKVDLEKEKEVYDVAEQFHKESSIHTVFTYKNIRNVM